MTGPFELEEWQRQLLARAGLDADAVQRILNQKPIEPPKYGEPARAKCSAPGRSLGSRMVLYVSAHDNDLYIDEWDPDGDPMVLDLPMPSDEALLAANAGLRYRAASDVQNAQAQIDQWIKDYGYSPDDIVLGRAGLTADQLTDLHGLLDLARPGWRSIFAGDS